MAYSDLSQRPSGTVSSRGSRGDALVIGRSTRFIFAVLLAVFALAALATPRAGAVSDAEELTRFGGPGSGAGQLSAQEGIATDPVTGHAYVVESGNGGRVSEFTPWGNFVKAFGWDVAPGAVNEQQEVRVRASSGQFRLTFGASSTPDLPFDASGAEVEAALNALASIGGAGGEASVEGNPGTTNGQTPFIHVVTFKGSLAATNVTQQLTVSNGTTPISGGAPATELEARTRADGTAGGAGLESCTEESGCKAGLEGGGAGQFAGSRGVAIDAAGSLYVKESGNLRVQKFDSVGRFLLTFGGEVNKTTSANVCTAASGDLCGVGVAGTDPGEFTAGFSAGLALGSGGRLFVADNERIQRFNLQGEYQAQLPVPGDIVARLAFDPLSEDLYATFEVASDLHRLDSITGAEVGQLAGQGPVATDSSGNVYTVGDGTTGETTGAVVQYNAGGNPLSPFTCCTSPLPPHLFYGVKGLGTNALGDLYVSYGSAFSTPGNFVRVFGPPPVSFEGPPPLPPEITDQYATSVGRTDAVLAAEINPHFFTNARFYVQYGTGKCFEGGCLEEKPTPPGALLTSKVIDGTVKSSGVFLEGLKPGTTYHYRFVAESAGGGPVHGIGGEVGIDGEESTFTTYPAQAPPKADCPNQAFRTGFSAPLPDCRAFEMVSPVDKNSGDVKALIEILGFTTSLEQSSADGDKFTYSSYRAFAGAESGAYTMQYLAKREEGVGWASEAINPPHGHAATDDINDLQATYKAFSADLCNGWLGVAAEVPLSPLPMEGFRDLYRRDNCGGEGHEALIQVEPTVSPGKFFPEFQGASADGSEAIFRVRDKLTEEAASNAWQAYYASAGGLRLLCILPSGAPSGGNCSAGTGDSYSGGSVGISSLNRISSVTHAISAAGDRVYWTASEKESLPGKVYLRLSPGEEQSEVSGGECTEAEKACTLKVSETVSAKAARFLDATPDGAKALFEVTEGTLAGNLYRFDPEAEGTPSTLIAEKTLGIAGTSEDLSRIYFVSTEALDGAAEAGKPNLYLDQGGTKTFIATLATTDVLPAEIPSNTSSQPVRHAARVSPDGSHLAFISTESLSGYDNRDQTTGEALSEVYLYEAGSPGPLCVSCNPSGARPMGRLVQGVGNSASSLATAASIPAAQFMHHFPRTLSDDGQRLFFDSYDPLLPRDANGKADVYEWEAAASAKECKELGAELHVPSSGGCLSLISSGQSPQDSQLLDASPDGDDVFFTTNASLLPQDPGLIDVYDARANGGLPGPPEPPGPCQGDACQIAPPPPNDPTPASASFKGAGSPSAKEPRRRCAKGKARRKGRCVRKRAKGGRQSSRAANHNRRQSR